MTTYPRTETHGSMCGCRRCNYPEPVRPEPDLTKQLAASILVKRTERQVLPLLRAIRDSDLTYMDAILELRLRGFAREAGRIIAALESDTEIALHGTTESAGSQGC